MDQPKHSQGPWKANLEPDRNTFFIQAGNRGIVDVAQVMPIRSHTAANAYMLAAAPEMFAALVEIIAAYDANDSAGIREGIEASRSVVAKAAPDCVKAGG